MITHHQRRSLPDGQSLGSPSASMNWPLTMAGRVQVTFEPGDMRLGITDGDAKLPLREARPATQMVQHLTKQIKRRRGHRNGLLITDMGALQLGEDAAEVINRHRIVAPL